MTSTTSPPPPSVAFSATQSCESQPELDTPAAAATAEEALVLLPEVAATGRPTGSRRPFQRRRRSRACDACRARKTKCDTPDSGPCSACAAASLVCKFSEGGEDRRRAGPARRIRSLESQVTDLSRKLQEAEAQLLLLGVSTPRVAKAPLPSTSDSSSPQFPPSSSSGTVDQTWWHQQQQHHAHQQHQGAFERPLSCRGSVLYAADSNSEFIEAYKQYLRSLGYDAEVPVVEEQSSRIPLLSEYPSIINTAMPLDLRVLLPPKPLAERLLAVFSKTILQYTPMFCQPTLDSLFERAWASPLWEEDRQAVKAVFCIVVMLMAVASQMVETPGLEDIVGSGEEDPPHLQERTGWKFFHLGRKYADLNGPHYTTNDAMFLLLMSMYLDNASLPSPGWMVTGALTRVCQDISLDRTPPASITEPISIESRNRLFWAAYIQERKSSLKKGRPFIFHDSDITIPGPKALDPPQDETDALHCFRTQIHISRILDELSSIRLEESGGLRDLQTIQSIDEKLKTAWEEFPAYLTNLQNLEPLETSALRPLFYLQYCRLLLYRFFVPPAPPSPDTAPLNADFRRICLSQSIQVAKITAHLTFRASKQPTFDSSFGLESDELVQLQTFRAAVILLLANTSVAREEIAICVRALESAARFHSEGSKLLAVWRAFARSVGWARSVKEEAGAGEPGIPMATATSQWDMYHPPPPQLPPPQPASQMYWEELGVAVPPPPPTPVRFAGSMVGGAGPQQVPPEAGNVHIDWEAVQQALESTGAAGHGAGWIGA